MLSDIFSQTIREAITKIKNEAKINSRKFIETIELQMSLKNYDPKKDKRFSGIVSLPYIPRPNQKIAVIGDAVHLAEASRQGVDSYGLNDLKKFNKQKKQIRKFSKKYDHFLASESIIKSIPRVLGPGLNKAGKFPSLLSHSDDLSQKISYIKSCIKFELKKTLCMGVALGNTTMENKDLVQNILLAINFFVSLLKKNWQNIKSMYLKSTMGKPIRIH